MNLGLGFDFSALHTTKIKTLHPSQIQKRKAFHFNFLTYSFRESNVTSPKPPRHSPARNTHSASAPPTYLAPAEESLPPAPSCMSHPASYSTGSKPRCTGSVCPSPPARKYYVRHPHSPEKTLTHRKPAQSAPKLS